MFSAPYSFRLFYILSVLRIFSPFFWFIIFAFSFGSFFRFPLQFPKVVA